MGNRTAWKRALGMLCVFALVFTITGCIMDNGSGSIGQPDIGSTGQTETSGTNASSPTGNSITSDPSTWPVLSPYTGTPLLEADPDREFYISLANQDCDLYPSAFSRSFGFDVITKENYDGRVTVEVPAESRHEVSIRNLDSVFQYIAMNLETNSVGHDGQLPYHHLCMQDVDLKELGQMRSDAGCANRVISSLLLDGKAEEAKTLSEKYVTPYTTLFQQYRDAYRAQGDATVTDYHRYRVTVQFDMERLRDEEIEYLDISFGGETHRIHFGQWRLHSEDPEELNRTHKGLGVGTMAVLGAPNDSPYAGGYIRIFNAIKFNASADVTLTGLRWVGGMDLEALGAQIVTESEENALDLMWDGQQPLALKKGDKATLSAFLYGERLKEYEASFTGFLQLEYVLVDTGAEYTVSVPCRVARNNEPWDTYCLAFLGVDVGEYYHYFQDEVYQLFWLNQIPESWRK